MIKPEQRIPVGSRVRLRDGVDPGLYQGLSRVGNEGWVRGKKLDKYEYPVVLIEWDKDHWSYNGAPNCWTPEGHFDMVEEPVSEKETDDLEDTVNDLTANFAAGLVKALRGDKSEPPQETEQAEAKSEEIPSEEWDGAVAEATTAIKGSKAFILISLQQQEQSDGEDSVSLIYPMILQQARSEEFGLICQAQVPHLATMLHHNLITGAMQRLKEKSREES